MTAGPNATLLAVIDRRYRINIGMFLNHVERADEIDVDDTGKIVGSHRPPLPHKYRAVRAEQVASDTDALNLWIG